VHDADLFERGGLDCLEKRGLVDAFAARPRRHDRIRPPELETR
jgi:hypothetical protein